MTAKIHHPRFPPPVSHDRHSFNIITKLLWLNIEIDQDYLRIKLGVGLVRKRFSLNKIASAVVVKNHWYYGWGIRLRLWPQMVIFGVSGFDAVEIRMASGRICRIGTDVPRRLEQAITQALN